MEQSSFSAGRGDGKPAESSKCRSVPEIVPLASAAEIFRAHLIAAICRLPTFAKVIAPYPV
jgi:hypothetical protein